MTGERTLTTQQRPLRWAEMRDEHTPLLETIESFLVHRHDLSTATVANYRLAIEIFAKWADERLGRTVELADLEPGTVEAFLTHRRNTASAQCARSAWVALRSLARFLAERRVHHDDGERSDAGPARPHAGDSRARRMGFLAGAGRGAGRFAGAAPRVPQRASRGRSREHAGEQREE